MAVSVSLKNTAFSGPAKAVGPEEVPRGADRAGVLLPQTSVVACIVGDTQSTGHVEGEADDALEAGPVDGDGLAILIRDERAYPILEIVPGEAGEADLASAVEAIGVFAVVVFEFEGGEAGIAPALRREEVGAPDTLAGVELEDIAGVTDQAVGLAVVPVAVGYGSGADVHSVLKDQV